MNGWIFCVPTLTKKTLLLPSFKESRKARISKVVIHGGDNTISAKKWIDVLKWKVTIDSPIGHGMKLNMLCRDIIDR